METDLGYCPLPASSYQPSQRVAGQCQYSTTYEIRCWNLIVKVDIIDVSSLVLEADEVSEGRSHGQWHTRPSVVIDNFPAADGSVKS